MYCLVWWIVAYLPISIWDVGIFKIIELKARVFNVMHFFLVGLPEAKKLAVYDDNKGKFPIIFLIMHATIFSVDIFGALCCCLLCLKQVISSLFQKVIFINS